ncbi:hypothetical protein GCM10010977_11590 [Citricoccus zhacaiensis]|uniref:DUF456 domain-containing protein n=1 Tax=Citricoccus zhacaiensis TaxID=489142 RepID=A0ABQ2LXK4_9MICC|nr:hypothetical protein GCM10010977_11590 [Citricoccus zhacaiensis]
MLVVDELRDADGGEADAELVVLDFSGDADEHDSTLACRARFGEGRCRHHTGHVDYEIITTVIAGLLLVVAVLGTIIPILPGSILTVITLIGWAWVLGSPAAWTAAIIGAGLAIAGLSASAVLTGRKMKREQIPNGPVLVGVVCAIVGMFVIPVVGLFVGFAVGLLAAEFARRRDFKAAARSSWEALKSMGLGILVEFGCASLAASSFAIGTLVHFLNR